MRLHKISFRGVTRFHDAEPVTLELDALGTGLVALVGDNGAGKTTCLEVAIAALYRSFPSRPGWYENFSGRDAFIEATFWDLESADEVTVRTQVDAELRKTEQFVFVNGASVTTGRAKEAEAEIEKRFGSLSLLLASVFASQGKEGNFLLLPKRDRKALMVELLGLSYLETLHEGAKMHRSTNQNALAGARAVLEAAESELAALPELEEREAAAKGDVSELERQLGKAREGEAEASDVMARARAAAEQLATLQKTLEGTGRELQVAERNVQDAEALPKRIAEEKERQLETINASDPDALERRARERYAKDVASLEERKRSLEATIAREPEVDAATEELRSLEQETQELEAAEKKVIEFRGDEKAAQGNLIAARRSHSDAAGWVEMERERLQNQSALLEDVPCTEVGTWRPGDMKGPVRALSTKCPLLANAREATGDLRALKEPDDKAVKDAQEQLEQAQALVAEAAIGSDPVRLEEIGARIPALRETSSQASMIVAAKLELNSLAGSRETADQGLATELAHAANARDRVAAQRDEVERQAEAALKEVRTKFAGAAEALQQAFDRHGRASEGYSRAVDASELDIDSAQERHEKAATRRQHAEVDLRAADQRLAALSGQLEQLRDKERSLNDQRVRVAQSETTVGDWDLLARALGRDGIQALEIDASGPEVARLTNELLEACYDTRFAIAFETLREKKSARGEFTEVFDVKVFDRGLERSAERISGGERVVVGEAVGLALSIFNARKSGIRWRTFFRDETVGALDPANAEKYVLMLRKALQLAGAHQIIFVSHSQAVWESADAQLLVRDGGVTLGGEHAERRVSEKKAAAV